jgi:hypothetical protein
MRTPTSFIVLAFAVLSLGAAGVMCTAAQAQTTPEKTASIKSYEIYVPGTKEWVDSDGFLL